MDAVLNLNGKAVLLSNLRDTNAIENCAFVFAGIALFGILAIFVISYVVTTVAPIIAGNFGLGNTMVGPILKPSFGGGGSSSGSGSSSNGTSSINKPISSYTSITAALAAGVPMSVSLCEQFYPGSEVTDEKEEMTGKKIITGKWTKAKVREMMRDLLKAALAEKVAEELLKEYIYVISYNNAGPTKVQVDKLYTKSEMASGMKYDSWSSLTYKEGLAKDVVIEAFKKNYPGGKTVKHENYNIDNIVAMYHFHWIDVDSGHQGGVTGANKKYGVHSFYGEILGVKI